MLGDGDAAGAPHPGRRPTRRSRRSGSTRFEGAGLDGVVAKPLDGTYKEGKRTMLKVKHLRTADCVVAGFRTHKDGNGVGSLLLGLYDDEGTLHHVGVASQLRRAAAARSWSRSSRRTATDALEGHPWRGVGRRRRPRRRAAHARRAEPVERQEGHDAGSRCASSSSPRSRTSTCSGDRFRHTARFQRWRPDRDPSSCTYEQLEAPVPAELRGDLRHLGDRRRRPAGTDGGRNRRNPCILSRFGRATDYRMSGDGHPQATGTWARAHVFS